MNGPKERAAHVAQIVGDKLVVFGGWNGSVPLNDVYVFCFTTQRWTTCVSTGAVPSPRNNHAAEVHGNFIYVHGGHDGNHWLDDFYVADFTDVVKHGSDKVMWSRPSTQGPAPSSRACHSLTRIGNKLFVFGGFDGTTCFNSLYVLNLETMEWAEPRTGGTAPIARNAHAACAVGDNQLFIYGGHSGREHLNQLHVYNIDLRTWATPLMGGDLPQGMRGHSMVWLGDNRIALFGGYNGDKRLNSTFLLDVQTFSWQIIHAGGSLPQGRQRHSVNLRIRHSRSPYESTTADLVVFGGFDGSQWLDDLQVLSIPFASKAPLMNQQPQAMSTSSYPFQGTYPPQGASQAQQPLLTAFHSSAAPTTPLAAQAAIPNHQSAAAAQNAALAESQAACLSRYRRLIDDPQFADVILSVDGRELHAHRCILASQSPHFHQLFSNPQYAAQPGHVIHVKMAGASLEAYAALVEYFYTGAAGEQDHGQNVVELLGELYGLAKQFEALGLVKRCEERLVQLLEHKTCWVILRIADTQKASNLRQQALDYILRNYQTVVQSEGFNEMKDHPKLIMEIAKLVATAGMH